ARVRRLSLTEAGGAAVALRAFRCLLARLGRGRRSRAPIAVASPGLAVDPLPDAGDQGGEGSREGIHLVGGELRAVGQMGRLLGEQALQAEHEREVAAPLDRRGLAPLLDLVEGGGEGPAPGGAGGGG